MYVRGTQAEKQSVLVLCKLDQLSERKYNFFKKVTKYVSIYIDSKVQLPERAFFNAISPQVDYKVSLCNPKGVYLNLVLKGK